MKKSKKAWVIGFMCVSLCAAIYLNWFFKSRETGKNLGEGMFVGNSSVVESEKKNEAEEYFTNARLERKNAQDKEAAVLNEIINSDNSTEEAKTQASSELVALNKATGRQAAIESLVLAKGYADCLAYVSEDHVTVVVNKVSLEQSDVIVIKDIATKETGIPASGVQVFEARISGAAETGGEAENVSGEAVNESGESQNGGSDSKEV